MLQQTLDEKYGPFRLMRGTEVLRIGGMTELEVTELAYEIQGTHIEHRDPATGIWRNW